MALRHDGDWNRDVFPVEHSDDEGWSRFEVSFDAPFRYFKPVLHTGRGMRWSVGDNYLLLAHGPATRTVHPYFDVDAHCTLCERREAAAEDGARFHYRVFTPPGYDENHLERYPVLYMHDAQNLFFPEESFLGDTWQVEQTLADLDAMNALCRVLVVGVYPNDRMADYTLPGYSRYGRFLARTLKQEVDREFRTLPEARHTAVLGSSLGGVVSFYLGWEFSDVFGMAGCMSSTFGYRDDLFDRVRSEVRPAVRLYLDSGWPRDNYEVTRSLRALLVSRGFQEGEDLLYFAFPQAAHHERAWARRVHLPFQFFFGGRALREH